jgi:basic amino acid/polyamine antiporter, APA family
MSEPHFLKRLGLFDATMLVAGSMIGSGIYIVSHDIAQETNGAGWLILVWAITGVMTVLGALSYAELAAMMPQAGGQYVYLREAYSPMSGFLYGWTSFTVIQTGTIAAVGVAFAKYLGVLVPKLGTTGPALIWSSGTKDNPFFAGLPLPVPGLKDPIMLFAVETFRVHWGQFVGVAIVLLLTAWNTLGVQKGKILQNVFTVTKAGSLIAVIAIAFFVTSKSEIWHTNWDQPWSGITQTKPYTEVAGKLPHAGSFWAAMVMGGALVGALFSADAWNNVTFTAGEVHHPQRNLPLSLIFGTGGVIALYLLANCGYLTSLTIPEIANAPDDRVATALVNKAAPDNGSKAMAIAIMISTFGCANGLILMGARLTYAMSQDGLFFRSVGHLNRHSVPAAGLWFQAIWASILTFSGTYGNLLDYVIFAALLFYVLTATGLFVLRFRQPNAPRPYRAWGYPLLPALYVLLCLAVMVDLLIVKPVYTWPGLILVLLGVPVYFLWKVFSPKPAVTD